MLFSPVLWVSLRFITQFCFGEGGRWGGVEGVVKGDIQKNQMGKLLRNGRFYEHSSYDELMKVNACLQNLGLNRTTGNLQTKSN